VSIKARLTALDFVAPRPGVAFANDTERVAYCDAMGIDRGRLPRWRVRAFLSPAVSIRYFPESSPMGILEDGTHPRVLVCAYIDDGARSVAGFETYLRQYARLLAVVPAWRVIYVSESLRQGHAAARAFGRAFGEDPWPETISATAVAIREYFHLRQAFEAQDWAALDKTQLDRFRDFTVARISSKQGLSADTVVSVLAPSDGGVRWIAHGDARRKGTTHLMTT
jgi:hypothetical protein